MILSKRIEDAEKGIVHLRDQLNEHLATVDDENPDDAAMTVTEELTTKIGLAERNLSALKSAEARLAANGNGRENGGGNGGGDSHRTAVPSAGWRIPAPLCAMRIRPSPSA